MNALIDHIIKQTVTPWARMRYRIQIWLRILFPILRGRRKV